MSNGFEDDFFCGVEVGPSWTQEQPPIAWAAESVAAGARPAAPKGREAQACIQEREGNASMDVEDESYARTHDAIFESSEEAEPRSLTSETSHRVIVGDCFDVLDDFEDNTFDLVVASPPYENLRSYGVDFNLKGQDWVDWAVDRYMKCVRVTKGLVVWVVEGSTRNFRWSATPALLMADLHRKGVKLRKPPVFHRVGIPGSGGPDFWRNDWEFIVCSSKGRLPWSDACATGKPPKYGPGGEMSHRIKNGERKHNPGRRANGKTEDQTYRPPKLANPGNVIHCAVGGGRMGDKLAHENEAPFPEALVMPFIKCFCPPGGTVLDTFSGSGTVLAVAKKLGRNSIGIDIRQSQADLTMKRLSGINVETTS